MTYQPHDIDTDSVLDDLVKQFADPMSFFRELIQNSIDAGSGEIDIRLEYEQRDRDDGVLVVNIDDFGEGMSREIIETKLTRLFSSGKDEDFTKIGRFGIGFVSVFAIEPQAVCVDTGRAGEYWRVLFHADKQFDLIQLDMPVEGTQIRVIKSMSPEDYQRFARRTVEVVSYWCRYVQVPIYIDGEMVNADFDIDSVCKATFEEEGTRIVAGFVPELNAHCGYYNRGLTLKEANDSPWPHVAIKVDSRYLEHTLTRDQVLQDKHFHKAKKLMSRLVEKQLVEVLCTSLHQAARRYMAEPDAYEVLCQAALYHLQHAQKTDTLVDAKILPTLYGEPISLKEANRRQGKKELYWCTSRSHLTDALLEQTTLLCCAPNSKIHDLFVTYTDRPLTSLSQHIVMPRPSTIGNSHNERALCDALTQLAKVLKATPQWVGFGHLDYEQSPVGNALVMLCNDRHKPVFRDEMLPLSKGGLRKAHHVVLNADLDEIGKLARVASREPEWAAYTLLKMILLHHQITAQDDMALVQASLRLREQRLQRR